MKVYLVTVVLMNGTDFESEYATNVALTRPVAEAIMDKLVKETQYPLDEYYYIREVEVEDEDSVKESSSRVTTRIENKSGTTPIGALSLMHGQICCDLGQCWWLMIYREEQNKKLIKKKRKSQMEQQIDPFKDITFEQFINRFYDLLNQFSKITQTIRGFLYAR